ncbi:unnamed protein product [Lampetra fluviatilis]
MSGRYLIARQVSRRNRERERLEKASTFGFGHWDRFASQPICHSELLLLLLPLASRAPPPIALWHEKSQTVIEEQRALPGEPSGELGIAS